MGETYDLDHDPVILVQARWRLAMAQVFWLGVTGGAVWGLATAGGDGKAIVSVMLMLPISATAGVVQAIRLYRPAQLIIEPSGISFRSPFRTAEWKWADLKAIDIDSSRGFEWVSLRWKAPPEMSGDRAMAAELWSSTSLPRGWPISASRLRILLRDGLARWG